MWSPSTEQTPLTPAGSALSARQGLPEPPPRAGPAPAPGIIVNIFRV